MSDLRVIRLSATRLSTILMPAILLSEIQLRMFQLLNFVLKLSQRMQNAALNNLIFDYHIKIMSFQWILRLFERYFSVKSTAVCHAIRGTDSSLPKTEQLPL
jgi:hypothetical protein